MAVRVELEKDGQAKRELERKKGCGGGNVLEEGWRTECTRVKTQGFPDSSEVQPEVRPETDFDPSHTLLYKGLYRLKL